IWLENGKIMYSGDASQAVDRYLAAVKKQPVVMDFVSDRGPIGEQTEGHLLKSNAAGETTIPNIDRRLGDQRCVFIGLGMFNENMQRLQTVENDSLLVLRLTIRNNSLEEGRPLVVGYCLRNHRGIDLASNNSTVEDTVINSPPVDSQLTIRISIQLPVLHPGSYSFSITMGYKGENGVMQDSDSITNAVVFELTSRRTVHVLMSLDSSFEVEEEG
ncbi:Wzt carbohydrate-binding domain-containing protein, partial [Pseudomonadota bacterium]|nr:Wzt carbohydrate-binding domain-containing protein [Pseudomonadota bacterium]